MTARQSVGSPCGDVERPEVTPSSAPSAVPAGEGPPASPADPSLSPAYQRTIARIAWVKANDPEGWKVAAEGVR